MSNKPKRKSIKVHIRKSSVNESDSLIKSKDQYHSTLKTFFYSFPELSISSRKIAINTEDCITIDDLKKKISTNLHIPNNQLKFQNPPKEELENLEDHFEFTLIMDNPHPNIDILMPNGEKIKINDCYNKNFTQIFECIEKHHHFYSQNCIKNNIKFNINGVEISRTGYPFSSIQKPTTAELKIIGKTVTLKYSKFDFTFSDGESTLMAESLIRKEFPSSRVSIIDFKGIHVYRLNSTEKYTIKIESFIAFKNVNNYLLSYTFYIDSLSTVSDAQKVLSEKLSQFYGQIGPEKITIIDFNRKEISDLEKPLINYQNLDKDFYYKIDTKDLNQEQISLLNLDYNKNRSLEKFPFEFNQRNDMFNTKNIKNFLYSIPELSINYSYITINTDECQTINDLKRKISFNLNISNNQLKFENPPKLDLKNLNNYYEFKLMINSAKIDLDILMPDRKIIKINDCYKKSYNEFLECLQKEGFYFTYSFVKNNLHLFLNDDEIKLERYPFLSIKKNGTINIKFIGNVRKIKYGNINFIYNGNDSSFEIKMLIQKAFPSFMVTIKDSDGNYSYNLNSPEKLIIKVEKSVSFLSIENNFQSRYTYIDYFDKIFDVQKKLAEKMSFYDKQIEPEDVILYDNNKKKITDLNKPLNNIQNLNQQFYYEIKTNKKPSNSTSNSEVERLKQIIEEQKSRINELEKLLLEETNKNQQNKSIEIQQNKSIQVLNIDQINNLERIKKREDNPSGTSYEVCQNIKQTFILKIMNGTSFENFQSYVNEHEKLKILDHPNILKTYGIFLSDEKNPPSILLEHWTFNLEERIKKNKLTNFEIISFIYEIAEGMRYVHYQKIIHRNLNANTVFIADDGLIKIGEFGISKFISPSDQFTLSMKGLISSMQFMAPEVIDDEKYNEKVDVYSFGILVLFLLNDGKIPKFKANKKLKGNQIDIPSSFTEFSNELISQCTSLDPQERPDFDSICTDIKDNYYKLIKVTPNEKKQIRSFIKKHKEKIPDYSD